MTAQGDDVGDLAVLGPPAESLGRDAQDAGSLRRAQIPIVVEILRQRHPSFLLQMRSLGDLSARRGWPFSAICGGGREIE